MKNKILFAILIMGALHMTNSTANAANPLVRMTTSAGVIDIEVFPGQAPQTAANFLAYVDAGFYDGTIRRVRQSGEGNGRRQRHRQSQNRQQRPVPGCAGG